MKEFGVGLGEEKILDELATQGKTPMYLAIGNKLAGVIAVADILKDEAIETIKELQKRGYYIGMITGDNKLTAQAIGKQVGIDIQDYRFIMQSFGSACVELLYVRI